jgi:hypothetical protein
MNNPKHSKFRHLKPTPDTQNKEISNVQPTSAIWDCGNFLAVNEKHIAVPWSTLGSVVILGHNDYGKVPTLPPMLMGHEGPVIDLAFHPFSQDTLFTASEDCTIRGWRIPEGGLKTSDVAPVVTLKGHAKKVGLLVWHPSAANVLASSGPDAVINLWDVNHEAPKIALKAKDQVLSVNWNLDGTLLNTTTKDKKVSILDSHTGSVVASADAHQGSKTQRSIWAKRRGLIVTVGFDRKQMRQAMVWDVRNLVKPICTEEIDNASTVMAPFYDEDTNLLYISGRGDGSVKFFDLWEDERPIRFLNAFSINETQRAIAFMPKTSLDVKNCEVARYYRLTPKTISAVSMIQPRRTGSMEFQDDLYPPTFANTPAIDAEAFFAGKNAEPSVTSMTGLFTGESLTTTSGNAVGDSAVGTPASNHSSPVRAAAPAPVKAASPASTWDGKSEPTDAQLKDQEDIVRDLESQLTAARKRLADMAAAKPGYELSAELAGEKKEKKEKKDKKDKADKKDKKEKEGDGELADAEAAAAAKKKADEEAAATAKAAAEEERKKREEEERKRKEAEEEARKKKQAEEEEARKKKETEEKAAAAAATASKKAAAESSGSESDSDSSASSNEE